MQANLRHALGDKGLKVVSQAGKEKAIKENMEVAPRNLESQFEVVETKGAEPPEASIAYLQQDSQQSQAMATPNQQRQSHSTLNVKKSADGQPMVNNTILTPLGAGASTRRKVEVNGESLMPGMEEIDKHLYRTMISKKGKPKKALVTPGAQKGHAAAKEGDDTIPQHPKGEETVSKEELVDNKEEANVFSSDNADGEALTPANESLSKGQTTLHKHFAKKESKAARKGPAAQSNKIAHKSGGQI